VDGILFGGDMTGQLRAGKAGEDHVRL